MLKIDNLSVAVEDQPIIKNLSLHIGSGTTHALMGPNGSGKSTLAYALMGHPYYTITSGSASIGDTVITDLSPDKRAKKGLFLAFQHPHALPGVSVFTFLKEAYHAVSGQKISVKEFKEQLAQYLELLAMDPVFLERSLNDGFSGGEKKRLEILQLLVIKPNVAILDEIDSGLDIDALKVVGDALAYARSQNPAMSVLLITHYQRILRYIKPDRVHVVMGGTIVHSGDDAVVQKLEQKGYDAITRQAAV